MQVVLKIKNLFTQNKNTLILFLAFVAVGFIEQDTYVQPHEHNILVLHSYHQGLEWTDNITSGILEVFENRTDVNFIFEYLDTKRNFNTEYFNALLNLYQVKVKQVPFDAIITSDNAAYNFIMKNGNEFFPNIPVYFCGINNLDTTTLKKHKNYKGVGEKANHDATLSSIEKIFPSRKNILIINDNTLTGKAIHKELSYVLKDFDSRLNFEFVSDFTLNSLQERVRQLDDSYAVYLLVINRDKNGKFISYENGIKQIKQVSNVPIFGSWDFYEGKGLFGGSIISGKEQGRYVASLAKHVIDHNNTDNIDQFIYLASEYSFDYNEMLQFGVQENQLPPNSVIINTPRHIEFLFQVALISIVFLIIFLVVVLINLWHKKRRQAEMEKTIEQRTTELHASNKKLSLIIKEKDRFLAILAHDLRNSVGGFFNLSTLLNKKNLLQNDEQSLLLRNNIQIAASQSYNLLEDLLYWGINQFNPNKGLDIHKFDVTRSFCRIIESFRLNANNIRLRKNCDSAIHLCSDKNICQFVFRNIIQNAIKYSHKNGEVRIASQKTTSGVTVTIEDDGIGMKKEVIDSIFAKTPITTEGKYGEMSAGMGLATVLDYLEKIDGKLSIESNPNNGSKFIIELKNLIE